MTDQFTSFKPAWHIRRIEDLRARRDIVPTHVQLIISDLCNQDCHFCAYRMSEGFSVEKFPDEQGNKNPKRFIPYEKCLEILDDCKALGVGAIQFTGGGEPTVHPQWASIITYAQNLGMQTGLVTNGIRLGAIHKSLLERLTWLRISLDAGTHTTYARIRRSDTFHKALAAIRFAAELQGPLVGIGYVVTRENWHELSRAAEIVKALNAPYIRVSAMFSNLAEEYYAGLLEGIRDEREKAQLLVNDKFKVVDFFDSRIKDLRDAKPNYSFCGFQQFVLYIGGDQKVYTCCTNAYTTHGEIGDLRSQRFATWFQSHRRYDFDARSCHHCQFNDKNRLINYLLEEEPPHVDFV